MDPTVLLILAILGFWVCAGVGAALMLGWLIRRARAGPTDPARHRAAVEEPRPARRRPWLGRRGGPAAADRARTTETTEETSVTGDVINRCVNMRAPHQKASGGIAMVRP